MDGNKFINSVVEIIGNELNKKSQDTICIVRSVNEDGTVNIVIPPDMENVIMNIKNESCSDLQPGSSAILYKVNNRINNSFIISGSGKPKLGVGSTNVVVKNGGISTTVSDDEDFSEIKQTVNEISLTVGSHTGDIANLSVKADSIESKVSSQDGKISTVEQTADSIQSEIKDATGSSTLKQTLDGIRAMVTGSSGNVVFRQDSAPSHREREEGQEEDPPLHNGDLWYNTNTLEGEYKPSTWYIWENGVWNETKDGDLSVLKEWKSGFTVEPNEISLFVEGNEEFLTPDNKKKISDYDSRITANAQEISSKVGETDYDEYKRAVSNEFTEVNQRINEISITASGGNVTLYSDSAPTERGKKKDPETGEEKIIPLVIGDLWFNMARYGSSPATTIYYHPTAEGDIPTPQNVADLWIDYNPTDGTETYYKSNSVDPVSWTKIDYKPKSWYRYTAIGTDPAKWVLIDNEEQARAENKIATLTISQGEITQRVQQINDEINDPDTGLVKKTETMSGQITTMSGQIDMKVEKETYDDDMDLIDSQFTAVNERIDGIVVTASGGNMTFYGDSIPQYRATPEGEDPIELVVGDLWYNMSSYGIQPNNETIYSQTEPTKRDDGSALKKNDFWIKYENGAESYKRVKSVTADGVPTWEVIQFRPHTWYRYTNSTASSAVDKWKIVDDSAQAKSTVATLKIGQTSIESRVTETEANIDGLNGRTDDLEGAVSDIDADINTATTGLKAVVSTHTSQIQQANDQIALRVLQSDYNADMTPVKNDVSEIKIKIDEIEQKVSSGNMTFYASSAPTNRGSDDKPLVAGDLWYYDVTYGKYPNETIYYHATTAQPYPLKRVDGTDLQVNDLWVDYDPTKQPNKQYSVRRYKGGDPSASGSWGSASTYLPRAWYRYSGSEWVLMPDQEPMITYYRLSSLKVTTDSISATVGSVQTSVGELGVRVTKNEGDITVNNDKIALVVTESEGENVVNAASIITGINSDGSSVQIKADKIKFDGKSYFQQDVFAANNMYVNDSVNSKTANVEEINLNGVDIVETPVTWTVNSISLSGGALPFGKKGNMYKIEQGYQLGHPLQTSHKFKLYYYVGMLKSIDVVAEPNGNISGAFSFYLPEEDVVDGMFPTMYFYSGGNPTTLITFDETLRYLTTFNSGIRVVDDDTKVTISKDGFYIVRGSTSKSISWDTFISKF